MILFLTNSYPDFADSFRGHFVKKLAAGVKSSGFPVVVLTPRVFLKSPKFEHEPEGFDVLRFSYPSGNRQLLEFKRVPYLRMVFFLISGFIATLKTVRSYKCKIIHAHWVVPTGLIGAFAGIFLKIPVIVHARGTDIHTYAKRGFLFRMITGWTLNRAHHIIAASHEMKQVMISGFNIQESKIDVIPTGIDTGMFSPDSGEKVPLNRKEKISLLYIGGLYSSKGIEDLMKASEILFKDNPNLNLKLVGEGPLRPSIEEWIERHGYMDRVCLTGSVSHNRIPEMLQHSDIFILPSLNEGTPNSLLEAMACGVPPVASRVGDIPYIIENEKDGIMFSPGAYKELMANICMLVEKPALYESIVTGAREKSFQFSNVVSLEKIKAIYEKVTGRK